MKFFSEQTQLINPQFFFIIIFSLNMLLFFNLGCGTKLNQKNYIQCIDELEKERKKVRLGKGFSYKAQSYEECRAPARYRLNSE
tara:strand:- start:618 stop:869 length:252 start_codon:yes stop_codon:yes gene_type:complete